MTHGWRREHLQQRVAHFRRGASALGLPLTASTSPIQPLIVGEDARAARLGAALFARGCWVGAIRAPTVPAGAARLRITFSAMHSLADIDALLEALDIEWRREFAQ